MICIASPHQGQVFLRGKTIHVFKSGHSKQTLFFKHKLEIPRRFGRVCRAYFRNDLAQKSI